MAAAGKSTLAYLLLEAVTNGDKFAGQFQTTKADVLMVQLDETYLDASKKFVLMGLALTLSESTSCGTSAQWRSQSCVRRLKRPTPRW